MRTFKAIGALLTYPGPELLRALDEIASALAREALVPAAHTAAIARLIEHLRRTDLWTLQQDYVALFDHTRALSLHLYEHLYGESRERGQALAQLLGVYERGGFELTARELPDYLPLLCEFLSLIPLPHARALLADAATVLELLRRRLDQRASPYAAAPAALTALAGEAVDARLLAELLEGGQEEDSLAALDARWQEQPVSFSPEAPPDIAGRIQDRAP